MQRCQVRAMSIRDSVYRHGTQRRRQGEEQGERLPPPPDTRKICKRWEIVHASASNENRY